MLDKTRETNVALKEQLRIEKEQLKKEINENRHNYLEKSRKSELEKMELQDKLNQVLQCVNKHVHNQVNKLGEKNKYPVLVHFYLSAMQIKEHQTKVL